MSVIRLQRELAELVTLVSAGGDNESVKERVLEIINELRNDINTPFLLDREQHVTILDCVILADSQGDEPVVDHRSRINNAVLVEIENVIRDIGGKTSHELGRKLSIKSPDELHDAVLSATGRVYADNSQNIDKVIQNALQQSSEKILRNKIFKGVKETVLDKLRYIEKRISNEITQVLIQELQDLNTRYVKLDKITGSVDYNSLNSKAQKSIKGILQDEMKKFNDDDFHSVLQNVEKKFLDDSLSYIIKGVEEALARFNLEVSSLAEPFVQPNIMKCVQIGELMQKDPVLARFMQDLEIKEPSVSSRIFVEASEKSANEAGQSTLEQNINIVRSAMQRNIEGILHDYEQQSQPLQKLCQRLLNEIPRDLASEMSGASIKRIKGFHSEEPAQDCVDLSRIVRKIKQIMQDEVRQNTELRRLLQDIYEKLTYEMPLYVAKSCMSEVDDKNFEAFAGRMSQDLYERMPNEMLLHTQGRQDSNRHREAVEAPLASGVNVVAAQQSSDEVNSVSARLENIAIQSNIQREHKM